MSRGSALPLRGQIPAFDPDRDARHQRMKPKSHTLLVYWPETGRLHPNGLVTEAVPHAHDVIDGQGKLQCEIKDDRPPS